MVRVALVTDSTADFPPNVDTIEDLYIIPMRVHLPNQTIDDRVDFSSRDCADLLNQGDLVPVFRQPSTTQFVEFFERLAEQYDEVVSIHLSQRLSGTFHSACAAADMVRGRVPVAVIDSMSTSLGLGLQVLHAHYLLQRNVPVSTLQAHLVEYRSQLHLVFLVDSLQYLQRVGRVGRRASLLSSILQLKPILRMEEGIIVPHAKTRTRSRAMHGLVQMISEIPAIARVGLVTTPGNRNLDRFEKQLARALPSDVEIVKSELSPVLMSHLGPGAIGLVIHESDSIAIEGRVA